MVIANFRVINSRDLILAHFPAGFFRQSPHKRIKPTDCNPWAWNDLNNRKAACAFCVKLIGFINNLVY